MTAVAQLDHVHVHVPPAPGNTDPRTLLLLHGTGGNERDLLEIGAALAPGVRLLGVRGAVLEAGMPRFFRRLAEGVFDEADVVRRAADLAAFIAAAAAAYGFDVRSVVAVGYSNGVNITGAVLLLHPGVLSGAVLFRSVAPLTPSVLQPMPATPVLLVEGAMDPLVPRPRAERLQALLSSAGASVTLHFEPAAHGLTPNDVAVARRWLEEHGLEHGL
jgi:phospholipase/carboxylesterase